MIAEMMPRSNADFDNDVRDLCSGRIPPTSKNISYGGASNAAANDAALDELEAFLKTTVEDVQHEPTPEPEAAFPSGDDDLNALLLGLGLDPVGHVQHEPMPEPEAVLESEPKPEPVSATTDCAPEPSDLFSSQRFTAALQEALNEDADTLLVRLTRMSAAICPTGAATFYGDELRAQFCAVSIALNTKGVMPVFRDVQHGRFTKGKPNSDADALLSRDLRIVDLDWIARHHHAGRSSAFKALLNKDGALNLARAFDFASQPTSAEAKAGDLGLDTKVQAELGMIKTNAVRDRLKHLRESKGRDRTKIGDAITKGHGRKKGDPECLYQLYVLCVMNKRSDNDWSISPVLDSATRLHGYTETPARIRGDIDWLKSIMVKDKDKDKVKVKVKDKIKVKVKGEVTCP